MSIEPVQRRIDFTIELLVELKSLSEQLSHMYSHIQRSTGDLFEEVFHQDRSNIQNEVEKYQANMQNIVQLNYESIEEINGWYDFSKDPREMKRLIYPVKFYLKRRKLKKNIKKTNLAMERLTLENRFIKEKLSEWEDEIGQKTLQQIKQGEQYQEYLLLTQRKSDLISDLEYLIATLPLSYPVEFSAKEIDSFINNLETISNASIGL